MRRFVPWLVLAASILSTISPAQQKTNEDKLSLPQYIQALDQALARTSAMKDQPQVAADLRDDLPSSWQVDADGKSFEIPTQALRRDIGSWQRTHDDQTQQRIFTYLQTLRSEAASYSTQAGDDAGRHALLNSILARHEFHNVHGPTWLDLLKLHIIRWLFKLFGRAITSSTIPAISNFLVYGLIVIAVLVAAFWMYRSLNESARLETIMPQAVPVSAKEWPIWLREARAAAARAQWRDAVHLAYWGGISFLEAQGAWRPDAARTPREYLRLLPAASEHQPALRSLTQRLEHVWYGMQSADATSFQQALAELEKLGCPCN
jgi:Domain of unknown function (DUF4129)